MIDRIPKQMPSNMARRDVREEMAFSTLISESERIMEKEKRALDTFNIFHSNADGGMGDAVELSVKQKALILSAVNLLVVFRITVFIYKPNKMFSRPREWFPSDTSAPIMVMDALYKSNEFMRSDLKPGFIQEIVETMAGRILNPPEPGDEEAVHRFDTAHGPTAKVN